VRLDGHGFSAACADEATADVDAEEAEDVLTPATDGVGGAADDALVEPVPGPAE